MSPASERIQSIINGLDDGAGRAALRCLLAIAFAVAVFAAYGFTQFHGLTEATAMDDAQIARNLAGGHGFSTLCTRPLDLHLQTGQEQASPRGPELRRAPFYPWLLSIASRVTRPSYDAPRPQETYAPERQTIIPLGILLSVLTALLIARLGALLFDSATGVLAAVLYVASDLVLLNGTSGTSRPCLAFLALTAAFAFTKYLRHQAGRSSARRWVGWFTASAVLCGIGMLAGYGMVVVTIALAVLAAQNAEQYRLTTFCSFVLIAAAVCAPWAIRNYRLTGNILGLSHFAALHNTVLYAGDLIERTAEPRLHSVLVLQAVRVKLTESLGHLNIGPIPTGGLGVIGCFFIVSLFSPHEREETRRLRWAITISMIIAVPWVAVSGGRSALLATMAPFVVLYGAGAFRAMLARLDHAADWRGVLVALLVVMTALPAALKITTGTGNRPYPPYAPAFIAAASQFMEQDEAIATDIPEATAWYGQRQALMLPVSTDELLALSETWRPVNAVHLTSVTANRAYADDLKNGAWQSWRGVFNLNVPTNFALRHAVALPPEGHNQVFLTDRVRWAESP